MYTKQQLFIEQAFKAKRKWLYILLPFFFLLICLADFLNADSQQDTEIQEMIKNWGELPVLVMMLLPFAFLLFFLLLIVRFVNKQPIISLLTGRNAFSWQRFFFSFGLWAVVVVASTCADYALAPENYVWNFQPEKFFILLIICILLIPIQTSFEEIFFRGYFLQGLGFYTQNKWLPLLLSSLLFGLLHAANPEVFKFGYAILFLYILSGLFLGVITLMDNGLELSLGFHAANNLLSALLVTSQWSAFQTPSLLKEIASPELSFAFFIPYIIGYSVLLFIFARKYHWKNWKNNLLGKI